jgi:hypothetical protein
VAQALLAEIGDDIGLIADQRQQRRGGGGVQTGLSCRLLTIPSVSARTFVQPRLSCASSSALRYFCSVTLRASSRSPRWISRFWILALSALTDCSLVCQVVRTLSRSDCETFCMVLRRW